MASADGDVVWAAGSSTIAERATLAALMEAEHTPPGRNLPLANSTFPCYEHSVSNGTPMAGRTSLAAAWLSGLVLGVIGGVSLMSLGAIGLAFIAISVLLIAWKGPRRLAAGGLVAGLGLVWTVLFARVQLTCGPHALIPDENCTSDDLAVWIAASVVVFAIGLVASALALRREARRG